jgi:uncharacterized protein (TIGR04255 family)
MVILIKGSYPNPPVIEVAWELKYNDPNFIDTSKEKLEKDFYDMVRGKYPNIEPIYESIIQFKLKPIDQRADNRLFGYSYTDQNENNFIKITRESLNIATRTHKNFQNFKEILLFVIKSFESLFVDFHKKQFERIGLRYVNLIEIFNNDKNQIEKYLKLPIDNNFATSSIKNFKFEMIQEINKDFLLKWIYQSIIAEGQPKILLDLDVFNQSSIKMINLVDNISDITTEMHKIIKEHFQKSITEEFVNEVMERS